jgi:hypothetical protein
MKISRIISVATAVVAVSVFCISGYWAVCQAAPPTGMRKDIPSGIKAGQTVQSNSPIKITSLRTGTVTKRLRTNDGAWTWTAVVENTGPAEIKKNTIKLEASAVYPSGEECVVSSVILDRDIPPGRKATISGQWSNCMVRNLILNAKPFPIASRSPLATKMTSVQAISAEIQNFTFVRDTKTWTAVIKNTSSVPLGFQTEGYGIRGATTDCFARQETKIIPAGGTIILTGRYTTWQPGTTIKYSVQNKCVYCGRGDEAVLPLNTFEYAY